MLKKVLKTCSKWIVIFFVMFIAGDLLSDIIYDTPNIYFEYIRSIVTVTSKSIVLQIRINGELSNQTFSIKNVPSFSSMHDYATNITCVGPVSNRSCLYKNLYYTDKTFWILTVKGAEFPFTDVRVGGFTTFEFSPERRTFFSYQELEAFVKFRTNPIVISNLTIYFEQPWIHNIGHALFDGLYPAYVALLRFAPKHLQPFRLLYDAPATGCQSCMSEDIFSRFADLGAIKLNDFENKSLRQWFVFDEFLVGSGKLCQRCFQRNLQLPGGIDLNGSRLFRDRMYLRHHLPVPVSRQQYAKERQNQAIRLRAAIIDNKRFNGQDRNEIHAAMFAINDETNRKMYSQTLNQNNPTTLLIHVHYFDFRTFSSSGAKLSKSKPVDPWKSSNKDFIRHLQFLSTIDIHVAGPGTGQMYQTFLADGTVHINLGGIMSVSERNKTRNYTSFLEQHVTAGTPYIKGLFYPINTRQNGIKKDEVIKLVLQATRLIINGFRIPVNPQENLAPDGLLFTEMCRLDPHFCNAVTRRPIEFEGSCTDTWPEEVVHETGPWSSDRLDSTNQSKKCSLNRTLLDELRKKYGIEHTV